MIQMSGWCSAVQKLDPFRFGYNQRRNDRISTLASFLHSMFGMNATTKAEQTDLVEKLADKFEAACMAHGCEPTDTYESRGYGQGGFRVPMPVYEACTALRLANERLESML